jgi:hypothetical protein
MKEYRLVKLGLNFSVLSAPPFYSIYKTKRDHHLRPNQEIGHKVQLDTLLF